MSPLNQGKIEEIATLFEGLQWKREEDTLFYYGVYLNSAIKSHKEDSIQVHLYGIDPYTGEPFSKESTYRQKEVECIKNDITSFLDKKMKGYNKAYGSSIGFFSINKEDSKESDLIDAIDSICEDIAFIIHPDECMVPCTKEQLAHTEDYFNERVLKHIIENKVALERTFLILGLDSSIERLSLNTILDRLYNNFDKISASHAIGSHLHVCNKHSFLKQYNQIVNA